LLIWALNFDDVATNRVMLFFYEQAKMEYSFNER